MASSMKYPLFWMCLTIYSIPLVLSIFNDSGQLPMDDLYQPGDLLLGGLVRLYFSRPGEPFCSSLAPTGVQVAAAIKYTINKINDDEGLLKNIRLGYAILNDCDRENVALARATKFLPLNQCVRESCEGRLSDGMIDGSEIPEFYNVVGVMGPYSSASAVPVASLLSVYKVPVMSWSATSVELSDKEKFGYFSRTIPADDSTVDAVVDILLQFGWTYVSALNTEGSYGTSAARLFRKKTKLRGICIAYEKELSPDDDDVAYEEVIKNLRNHSKAMVVVLFVDGHTTQNLMYALGEFQAAKEFIFIGSEGFQPKLSKGSKVPISALCITVRNPDPEFEDYYVKGNPLRDGRNPWIGEFTKEDLNCTWNINDGSGMNHCSNYKSFERVEKFQLYNGIGRVSNIVKTYALALDRLVEENCPSARYDKWDLPGCINGELLLGYMRNTSFQGPRYTVSYDSKGDVFGNLDITFVSGESVEVNNPNGIQVGSGQGRNNAASPKLDVITQYTETIVGSWERLSNRLIIHEDRLPWGKSEDESVPESVCAYPCNVGQYKKRGEVECCWTCSECRNNEIIVDNDNKCEKCPDKRWPKPPHRNECEPIMPTYMQWHDPYACTLMTFAVVGLISVIVIVFLVTKHWERKVIKGSSRELMITIVIGLTLAYATVFALIAKPSMIMCHLNYTGFNLSCSIMFGPLFLKTLRLHIIFQASERYKSRVKLADYRSLLTTLGFILGVQIVLMVVVILAEPIRVETTMKLPTIKESVELYCLIPLPVLLTPLSYNIILLFLCGVYGFLTRKLPENYNESWYIFIAVTTTLFVWTACIPTYFITFHFYHKAALLSMALVVNGLVISLCLFSPKIYALFYVDEKNIKITHMSSRRLSVAVGINDNRLNGNTL